MSCKRSCHKLPYSADLRNKIPTCKEERRIKVDFACAGSLLFIDIFCLLLNFPRLGCHKVRHGFSCRPSQQLDQDTTGLRRASTRTRLSKACHVSVAVKPAKHEQQQTGADPPQGQNVPNIPAINPTLVFIRRDCL